MKTYTHKNGMKAEQTTSHLFDWPRYNVKINKWVIWYNLFQFPVAEQELLDFWFIEDKQEELNTKSLEWAINSFKSCKIQTKTLYVDNLIEKLKQAVKDNPDKSVFIIDMNDKQDDWIKKAYNHFMSLPSMYGRWLDGKYDSEHNFRKAILKHYPLK